MPRSGGICIVFQSHGDTTVPSKFFMVDILRFSPADHVCRTVIPQGSTPNDHVTRGRISPCLAHGRWRLTDERHREPVETHQAAIHAYTGREIWQAGRLNTVRERWDNSCTGIWNPRSIPLKSPDSNTSPDLRLWYKPAKHLDSVAVIDRGQFRPRPRSR